MNLYNNRPSKKVYGYVRVSTIDQADNGDSIEAQTLNIIQYCKNNNLHLIDNFIDAGISGSVHPTKRPNMNKLLLNLKSGKADGLVSCKIDRISRSIRDFILLIGDFQDKYSLFIISPDINANTPAGKFSLHLLSAIAELERDMTIERTREVIQMKKSKNERIGSIPFGKKLIENTNILEDDSEEQRTIKIVKELREKTNIVNGKTKQTTYQEICNELVKLERKNKEGNISFYPSQIAKMLKGYDYKPTRKNKSNNNSMYIMK
jgi:DNA invertase Pin-like site-specific DNA recombinase